MFEIPFRLSLAEDNNNVYFDLWHTFAGAEEYYHNIQVVYNRVPAIDLNRS